jgi:hypothetical protein
MMQISDASTNNVEKSDAVPLDVGLTLRQTREAMGLSVSDIANRISTHRESTRAALGLLQHGEKNSVTA